MKDIGAQVAYFNHAHRWNWGLVGGQIPYLSSGFQSAVSRLPNGDLVQTDQLFVFRQTERSASGVVVVSVRSRATPGVSGRRQQDLVRSDRARPRRSRSTPARSSRTRPRRRRSRETLTLGTSRRRTCSTRRCSARRARCRGSGSGSKRRRRSARSTSPGLLADYRRYFMPAPFYTLGVRVMHYGRYGSGSQDTRISRSTSDIRGSCAATTSTASTPTNASRRRLAAVRVDRSVAGQPHARGQRRVPLPAASSVRCHQATCTVRSRSKSRSSPMPARPGIRASSRRSTADRAGGLLGRRGASRESARLRRRRIRFRTGVPATGPWLDLRIQPDARLVTSHDLCTPLPQSCDN